MKVGIQRYSIKSISQGWELVGTGPEDTKPVWRRVAGVNPNQIMSINPTSITVVEFDLK